MDGAIKQKVETFFSARPARKYAKGQILIMPGEVSNDVILILEGKVKTYDVTYRGEEIIVNVFKEGAYFPMSHALGSIKENKYIYEAESDIVVKKAPAVEVVKFLKENPDVLLDLLSRVYTGTEGMLGRVTHLMAGSARSRILYELLIEARRFGEKSGKGYVLHLSETELSARAGLSRETVSREMHWLKGAGLVTIVQRDIHIKDVAAIEAALGTNI
jgi:CRP-like cAMP-binding protein